MHGTRLETEIKIDSQEFVEQMRPALCGGRLEEAAGIVRQRWSPQQISRLLKDPCTDVRKMAALALSLVGDHSSVRPLAVSLHDADPMVTQISEHALWAIWFRLGKPCAVKLVKQGNRHLQHENHICAIEKYSQAIESDCKFAEAFNQRAIAYYLCDQYEKAIDDCRQTLALMPEHFGAMAGMGHCHAHLGRWREAQKCYRVALAIHPRLEGIEASLNQIDRLMHEKPM